ncbi:hypothetical protein [Brevifollis gellanilyticus]|uniref:Bacterial OB-fold domain-containing protein n=1 Tax=Brevifollis gellanilyticus TaxID=748831 RepID=A0A512M879_9BACT|nr:hypothetical protein [Brevifollis gellanilyticus]GEP42937.1 hypothetical protein BGE01nite_22280 [Brevifollis gellanilyticus]
MKAALRHLLITLTGLTANAHADTWGLADGMSFEAQIKGVMPGMTIFTLASGLEQRIETSKLSDDSRKKLAESLGLVVAAPATTASAAPTPAMPQAAPGTASTTAGVMPTVARDPGAMDATDVNMIDSQFGKRGTVIGKVKTVITLGSSGHKKLTFEGTDFNVFISKRSLDQNSDWHLDDLAGKTVQVTGEVAKFQEQLQISPREPSQVGVVE